MTLEKENSTTKTTKTRLLYIMAIAGAFIAGSLAAGPFAFAQLSQCENNPPHGIASGPVWEEIWTTVCELEDRIDSITSGIGNIKHVTLQDGECVFDETISLFVGWCPGDNDGQPPVIQDLDVTQNSVIIATTSNGLVGFQGETGTAILMDLNAPFFVLQGPFDDGSTLNYVVINP